VQTADDVIELIYKNVALIVLNFLIIYLVCYTDGC